MILQTIGAFPKDKSNLNGNEGTKLCHDANLQISESPPPARKPYRVPKPLVCT